MPITAILQLSGPEEPSLTDSRYVQITRKVDAKQIELPMYEQRHGEDR